MNEMMSQAAPGDLLLMLIQAFASQYPTAAAILTAALAILSHQQFATLVRLIVKLTPTPADDSWAEFVLGWLKALALINPEK